VDSQGWDFGLDLGQGVWAAVPRALPLVLWRGLEPLRAQGTFAVCMLCDWAPWRATLGHERATGYGRDPADVQSHRHILQIIGLSNVPGHAGGKAKKNGRGETELHEVILLRGKSLAQLTRFRRYTRAAARDSGAGQAKS
jgi:hypothetical protein